MNTAKHTPGPWMQHGNYVITGNDAGPINALTPLDAAFIASAPYLLAEHDRLLAEHDRLLAEHDRLLAENERLRAALEVLLPAAEAFERQASKGTGGRRGGRVFEKARTALQREGG